MNNNGWKYLLSFIVCFISINMLFYLVVFIQLIYKIPGNTFTVISNPQITVDGTVTAYSECDYENCHTASGKVVDQGMVANNCLPFGTKVRIDNQIYVIEDRMHHKWDCKRFDIFMDTREKALNWGIKKISVDILL